MSNCLKLQVLFVVCALLWYPPKNSHAEIVLQSVNIDLGNTGARSTYTALTMPAIGQLTAVDFPIPTPPRPARTATLDYSLTQANGVAVFDFAQNGTFAHDYPFPQFGADNFWGLGGLSGGVVPLMSFTVDRPSTYEISGNYFASMTGLFPSQQSSTNYFIEFLEFENGSFGPPPNVLFRHQLSDNLNGASGSFTRSVSIGQLAGVANEILNGSLTGLLLPGNVYGYNLSFGAFTRNLRNPSGIVGSTSGSFTMTVTAVPEPESAILCTIGVVTLGLWRLRRKAKSHAIV